MIHSDLWLPNRSTILPTPKPQKYLLLFSLIDTLALIQHRQMRYIAAYLLLKIAGNDSPSARDISKVIEAVGIEVDEERVNTLLSELKGKDINAVGFISPSPLAPSLAYLSVAHRRGYWQASLRTCSCAPMGLLALIWLIS
jgi:60s Acidic ribosomal protein